MQNCRTNESLLIYLIEDDIDDIYLIRKALKHSDYTTDIMSFSDGEAFFTYLGQQSQHQANEKRLVMLDINMPGMDGYQTLQAIRSLGNDYAELPVCVFTTSSSKSEIKKCYKLGANACLVKPGSFDDMKSILNTIVEFWLRAA